MIEPGTTELLKDSKGRPIWTVTARPLSDGEKAQLDDAGRRRQDELLVVMRDRPGLSLAKLAEALNWRSKSGALNKTLVDRTMRMLEASGLVKKPGDHWELTKKGKQRVDDAAI